MSVEHVDLYSVLGVKSDAAPEDIQRAYRRAARRFHPDTNKNPTAAQEFNQVQTAYDMLYNSEQRAAYDLQRQGDYTDPYFQVKLVPSRPELVVLDDPQVIYLLLTVRASKLTAYQLEQPPLNIGLVIDRSTSMRGERLDQVKSAARQIIQNLQPQDTFSLVAFSDRAEVVFPATRDVRKTRAMSSLNSVQASGGTEILRGLTKGLIEVRRNMEPDSINHLVLLTDGRTYGDEKDCMDLAARAELDGITISGLGIGSEWNDEFLDKLTATTGGRTSYVASSEMVTRHLREHVLGLGDSFAERLLIRVTPNPGIELQQVFRLRPDPYPIEAATQPLRLGSLSRRNPLSLVLQFRMPPQRKVARQVYVARLTLVGDLLSLGRLGETTIFDFGIAVAEQEAAMLPPPAIIDALEKINLHNIQQKATREAEAGNVSQAVKHLEALGARLEENGEHRLAQQALREAQYLKRRHKLSDEGQKNLKYGTRALLLESPKN